MKRILIVDDEFLIRYTLEEGLRDRGHDTASVASVEEALEYVKKYHPAVVLLDNLLEHSVGMETIPALSRRPWRPLRKARATMCSSRLIWMRWISWSGAAWIR